MILTEISPLTEIKLLNVPWDSTYHNVLDYVSSAQQLSIMNNLVQSDGTSQYVFTNCQPVRDNVLSVKVNYDKLYNVNYVMYKNANFNNKWFFAFVVGKKWVNSEITELAIEIDIWNTWYFEFDIEDSYVVRQHTNDDTIGSNRIPESFELGNYITKHTSMLKKVSNNKDFMCQDLKPVIIASDYPDDLVSIAYGSNFNGMYYNGCYAIIPQYTTSEKNSKTLERVLNRFVENQKVDSIVNITFLNSEQISGLTNGENDITDGVVGVYNLKYTQPNYSDFFGFTPKNNKLYQYPYCYLEVSNLQGQQQEYYFEDFPTPTGATKPNVTFAGFMDISPNSSTFIAPNLYRQGGQVSDIYVLNDIGDDLNLTANLDYRISIENNVFASYAVDTYKAWLAQQGGMDYLNSTYARKQNLLTGSAEISREKTSLSQKTGLANSVIGGASSLAGGLGNALIGGALGGGVGSMALGIAGTLAGGAQTAISGYNEYKQAGYDMDLIDLQTNTQYAQNEADYNNMMRVAESMGDTAVIGNPCTNLSYGIFGFKCTTKCIRTEFARIIDDYWNKFGYPVHRVIQPHIHNRINWDYIQLNDGNISGTIPDSERQGIRDIFQNGVTVWHNINTFMDYSQNNGIVGG